MKVILIETVDNLGNAGEVVTVKDGYAMNYLIPKKLAMNANDRSAKAVEHKKLMLEHKFAKLKAKAVDSVSSIEKMSCTITRRAGEGEKLFGSVTSKDIEEYLANEGIKIDRKDITLAEPIKKLGIYTVPVKLYQGVMANLKVWVVPEDKKEDLQD